MSSSTSAADPQGVLTIEIVTIYVSIIGSLASLVLLLLVLDLKIWNDFIRMIYFMTVSQFIYDVLISCFSFPLGPWVEVICYMGAVSSFIISTMIAFSVLHVLYYKSIFNLKRFWWVWAVLVFVPNSIIFILLIHGFYVRDESLVRFGQDLVTYIRLFCLLLNLIFFALCKYQTCLIYNYFLDRNIPLSNSSIAMQVLINRLKYYPLVQACSRIPAAIYEFTYGFNFAYYDTNNIRFYLAVICTNVSLVSPIGFLLIYLKMQPKAYEQLKSRLNQIFCREAIVSGVGSYNDLSNPIIESRTSRSVEEFVVRPSAVIEEHQGDDRYTDNNLPVNLVPNESDFSESDLHESLAKRSMSSHVWRESFTAGENSQEGVSKDSTSSSTPSSAGLPPLTQTNNIRNTQGIEATNRQTTESARAGGSGSLSSNLAKEAKSTGSRYSSSIGTRTTAVSKSPVLPAESALQSIREEAIANLNDDELLVLLSSKSGVKFEF